MSDTDLRARLEAWLDTVPIQHQSWLSREGAGLVREAIAALTPRTSRADYCPSCGGSRDVCDCLAADIDRAAAAPAPDEFVDRGGESVERVRGLDAERALYDAAAPAPDPESDDLRKALEQIRSRPSDAAAPAPEGLDWYRKRCEWYAAELDRLRARPALSDGWDAETVKRQVADFNKLCDEIRRLKDENAALRRPAPERRDTAGDGIAAPARAIRPHCAHDGAINDLARSACVLCPCRLCLPVGVDMSDTDLRARLHRLRRRLAPVLHGVLWLEFCADIDDVQSALARPALSDETLRELARAFWESRYPIREADEAEATFEIRVLEAFARAVLARQQEQQ